jgi:hypothetical protein
VPQANDLTHVQALESHNSALQLVIIDVFFNVAISNFKLQFVTKNVVKRAGHAGSLLCRVMSEKKISRALQPRVKVFERKKAGNAHAILLERNLKPSAALPL